MTKRFPYDGTKVPAAPTVPIKITTAGGRTAALAAIVDTGADITVIPIRLAKDLRLPIVDEATVHGITGSERVRLYSVVLEIDGLTIPVQALGVGAQPLIGRDVINRWTVVLRGPQNVLELEAEINGVSAGGG